MIWNPQFQMLAYVALAMFLGGLVGLILLVLRWLGHVENRFAEEQPVPASPAEERS